MSKYEPIRKEFQSALLICYWDEEKQTFETQRQ